MRIALAIPYFTAHLCFIFYMLFQSVVSDHAKNFFKLNQNYAINHFTQFFSPTSAPYLVQARTVILTTTCPSPIVTRKPLHLHLPLI